MDDRKEFLTKMYEQMFRDIAQQITTVWQAVTTVFGSFAIIALSEKGIVPIDFGVTIAVGLCAWFILTINECSYWYNRNLTIIANIERQFLSASDLSQIHYYFGSHRPGNKMITQLKIQIFLGVFLLSTVLLYHFAGRVAPGLGLPLRQIDPTRALPYAGVAVAIGMVLWMVRKRNEGYRNFLRNSPGATVDTTGIQYGVGHGH